MNALFSELVQSFLELVLSHFCSPHPSDEPEILRCSSHAFCPIGPEPGHCPSSDKYRISASDLMEALAHLLNDVMRQFRDDASVVF